jgi:Flp pilus assembly secretin CpaC
MMAFALRGFAFVLGVLALFLASLANAADIHVILDQARLVKLPDRVATIVVGNPLIADVSIQAGGLMVVTGKGYGATNVMALDRSGKVLMDTLIHVQGPRGVVVVYRGVERETYSCTPNCEKRITLGDGNTYFTQTLSQTATRSAQAQAIAQSK